MCIERHYQLGFVDEIPDPPVYGVFSYHPPEIQVPSFERIRRRGFGEEKCQGVTVMKKVLARFPEGLTNISLIICFEHRADAAEISVDCP